jgi:uncharacterized iron-regulated membrane protein
MRFRLILHALHRWLALALAAQLVLWMASGVVMSFLSLAHVRGETAAALDAPAELEVHNYFPPAGVIAQLDGAQEVSLKTLLGREVYVVKGAAGAALFDADSGERLSPLSADLARQIARSDFVGEGEIVRAALLDDPPQEFGRPGPVWRVEFSDRDETRLYISPETGAVLARRNRVWRFYDFFWMLHIMDYEERENFNNPLLRIFAATGLAFVVSGLAMFVTEFGRYRADLARLWRRKRPPDETRARSV